MKGARALTKAAVAELAEGSGLGNASYSIRHNQCCSKYIQLSWKPLTLAWVEANRRWTGDSIAGTSFLARGTRRETKRIAAIVTGQR